MYFPYRYVCFVYFTINSLYRRKKFWVFCISLLEKYPTLKIKVFNISKTIQDIRNQFVASYYIIYRNAHFFKLIISTNIFKLKSYWWRITKIRLTTFGNFYLRVTLFKNISKWLRFFFFQNKKFIQGWWRKLKLKKIEIS